MRRYPTRRVANKAEYNFFSPSSAGERFLFLFYFFFPKELYQALAYIDIIMRRLKRRSTPLRRSRGVHNARLIIREVPAKRRREIFRITPSRNLTWRSFNYLGIAGLICKRFNTGVRLIHFARSFINFVILIRILKYRVLMREGYFITIRIHAKVNPWLRQRTDPWNRRDDANWPGELRGWDTIASRTTDASNASGVKVPTYTIFE